MVFKSFHFDYDKNLANISELEQRKLLQNVDVSKKMN